MVPIDVMGDGETFGVRVFITPVPASALHGAIVEAFGPDGTLLGQTTL